MYSDNELALIKLTFAENEPLLKLLRKVFLPNITDSSADIGGVATDIGVHPDYDLKNYPTIEQAMIGIQAHTKALQHLQGCLFNLKMLAGMKNETVEELKARLEKNSNK